eukprot:1432609-Rhodomonas_salina.1
MGANACSSGGPCALTIAWRPKRSCSVSRKLTRTGGCAGLSEVDILPFEERPGYTEFTVHLRRAALRAGNSDGLSGIGLVLQALHNPDDPYMVVEVDATGPGTAAFPSVIAAARGGLVFCHAVWWCGLRVGPVGCAAASDAGGCDSWDLAGGR